ncbi:PAS domain S-box protein [Dyadobacter sp. 676]|uniref:histidine kinase n=1 Tax=Dyadobacter sp. 676 TaxID=3088362 RepID=A0AAU8FFT1_9BACT
MASPSHLDGELFPVNPPDCQTFLASFAQATWEADVSGQVITDSPSWRAYTGQTFTEFSGMGWANAISPGDRAEVIHSWREAVARLEAFSAEFRVKSADDSWRWCNMQAAPIPNADGSIKNWLAIFTDMEGGGRHKADEKLHQATLDSSMDMIQVFKAVRDEAGEIVDFTWILNNHASEKFYGDVIGKSLLQLQPGVVQEGIFDAFKHVVETGVPQQYEKHYVHEQFNGWFHQSVVKLNDGVATTTSDITKLKITEQQLRVAKENLQTTLDSSQYVIQAFTAVRNEAGKIIDFVWVFTNRTWNQLYGEMAGKSLLQENPGVIEAGLFDKFVQVTEEGTIIDHEQYYSHEQFNGQWFHQTLVKMGDGFVMNTEDITQRKKDEAEILRLKDEIAERATDRYQTIFNSIDEGFCIYELIYNEKGKLVDLEWIEVNPAYEKQTGLKDVVGKRHSDLLLDTEDYWYEIYQTVSETGEPNHFDQWHQPTARWYRTYATRIGDANTRRVAVVFDDITERKQREEQQKFLLSLSDEFRELTDGVSIKEHAVKMLAEHLGLDRCWVSEVFEAEGFSTVGPEQVRPGLSPMSGVFQLSDYPETMRQLMTELMMVEDSAADPRFGEAEKLLLSSINLCALLVVPLRRGGQQVIWALAAAMSTPRRWTQIEQALMEDVAERTWEAVERAETEQQVRESEKRLRIATEAADMATWEWDLVRNRVVWNERHFQIFGLEPGGDPVRPETFFEHVHPADRERVDQLLRESLARDVEFDTEFRAILEDGSERWMSGYGRVMEWSGDQPVSMSGVMFDVTARRQAEQDLQHSQARQSAILESAKDYAIIALDLDLRVNHWNAGAEYMLGYSEEEIIGQSGEIFFVPEDRAKGAHEIEKENAIKDGRATNERWHLRKDGSRFYASGVTRPLLNEDGTVIGLLKVMRDLTHEKRSEDALKEASKRKTNSWRCLRTSCGIPSQRCAMGLQYSN